MSTPFKVAAILMLMVLLIGPMLQIYDCFNDALNLDHDALLHTVDALLCIAFGLVLSCLLVFALAFCRFLGNWLEQFQCCSFEPSYRRTTPFLGPLPLPLRI